MKRAATTLISSLVALVATAILASQAGAALRVPQVPVLGGTLQAYLNGVGESINVNTDQDAVQTFAHTTSATTAFTLQLELTGNAAVNNFGMYDGSAVVPALNLLISGPIIPQGFATGTFLAGNQLKVNFFDDNAIPIGSITYAGVNPSNFGFYLQTPNGTFFTQDARNPGGMAQAVIFAGTGANAGTWWCCFDDQSVAAGSDQDYDDCVVLMESVNPTPVNSTSWGQLKARFR